LNFDKDLNLWTAYHSLFPFIKAENRTMENAKSSLIGMLANELDLHTPDKNRNRFRRMEPPQYSKRSRNVKN
jgi:hypothetical protein